MTRLLPLLMLVCVHAAAQTPSSELQKFLKYTDAVIALTHVRVIDGTGAPANEDQTIVLRDGRIAAITDAATAPPADARVLDLRGRTALPGIVGMHNHLMYTASINFDEDGIFRRRDSS